MQIAGRNILFIDPGLEGTGYAFFIKIPGMVSLTTGILRAHNPGDWTVHAEELGDRLLDMSKGLMVCQAVIEFPSLWSGSSVSQTSAAKGDLFKLSFLIGVYAQALWSIPTVHRVLFIKPNEWKGQLPKKVVLARIIKADPRFKTRKLRNHEADAIGMGLAAQGLL